MRFGLPVFLVIVSALGAAVRPMLAEVKPLTPVTQQMLEQPSPDDWLMFSRTYDAQRFSPLNQITKDNVGRLALAWARGFGVGFSETVPLVYDGVMYLAAPGGLVQALDATTGDVVWGVRARPSARGRRWSAHEITRDLPGPHLLYGARRLRGWSGRAHGEAQVGSPDRASSHLGPPGRRRDDHQRGIVHA